MFKVNNKKTRTTSVVLFWCFYCWLWTCFTPFLMKHIDFELVNVSWVKTFFVTLVKLSGVFYADYGVIYLVGSFKLYLLPISSQYSFSVPPWKHFWCLTHFWPMFPFISPKTSENQHWIKAVQHFPKKLHLRCLTVFWVCFASKNAMKITLQCVQNVINALSFGPYSEPSHRSFFASPILCFTKFWIRICS